MSNEEATHILATFALEHAANAPLKRRVEIFRAAAAVMPKSDDRDQLVALADELEEIDKRQEQLLLKLRQEEM